MRLTINVRLTVYGFDISDFGSLINLMRQTSAEGAKFVGEFLGHATLRNILFLLPGDASALPLLWCKIIKIFLPFLLISNNNLKL